MQGIEIINLSKTYGKKRALRGINLSIPKGMYGLLGRNGAGKTSLMRIIVTLTKASEGNVLINNIPINEIKKIRHIIGYLPQNFSMYPNMEVSEALQYLGVLSGICKADIEKRIKDLLAAVNLKDQTEVKVRELSGGMKQRLGVAQALLHNPDVLVVDEPTAGLDPEERIRFRNLLCELSENKTVILSTHIAQDIEATCENVAVLDSGKIIFKGVLNKLIQKARGKVFEVLIPRDEIARLKQAGTVLTIQAQSSDNLMKCRILSEILPRYEYKECSPCLEDGYMQVIREKGYR